ncbi:hypothetical protein OG259_09500 [Streptomyces sp. NBC_00250]|uniref:hypothetical protein n=1 Tax=Streptomyces sp. NBC_00250 TaxID=2903641 RepID=UPI002E2C25A3|nr:hypothetical protein [Streptomyces sp. NBC_00250]
MKPSEEVLQELTQQSNISVHSDDALVGKVKAAVTADDKKRLRLGPRVRPRLTFDKDWGGPVSVHADGSVLALRLLPGQDEEPRPGSPR